MLARGSITRRGALPPERCIEPNEMFAELETRGVRFEVTSEAGDRPDIQVGRLRWSDARVDYTDRFVQPHYDADLSALQGSLSGFSSRSPELAVLELHGRVAGTGALATAVAETPPLQ